MFVRNVSMHLKPNTLNEVTRTLESAVVSGERDLVATSFWDEKENAEAYNASAYPHVLTSLGKVLEGTPHVRTLEVVSSTFPQDCSSHGRLIPHISRPNGGG